MLEMLSRQERFRILLTDLSSNNSVIGSTLNMFPKELERFQNEFPSLNFHVMKTVKTDNSKMHTVQVKRKH